MARNELRFGILGPLEISAGFRSLPLGTPKQRAVLATLIIHRNRPVGIDSLIDAAWEQDRRRDHERPCIRMSRICVGW